MVNTAIWWKSCQWWSVKNTGSDNPKLSGTAGTIPLWISTPGFAWRVQSPHRQRLAQKAPVWAALDSVQQTLRTGAPKIRPVDQSRPGSSLPPRPLSPTQRQPRSSHLPPNTQNDLTDKSFVNSNNAVTNSCPQIHCSLSQFCLMKTLTYPSLTEHLSKCLITVSLRLKYLPQEPQQNCLKSECFSWWHLISNAVQKLFEHSLQTYGFTSSWWSKCV